MFAVALVLLEGLVEVGGAGAQEAPSPSGEVELLAMRLLTCGGAASTECGGEGVGELSGSGDGGVRFAALADLETGREVLTIFGPGLLFFAGDSLDCSRGCKLYC